MGTYYGPKEFEPYVMAFWDPRGFLYSPWTKEKQDAFDVLYNFQVPYTGWSPFRDQFDSILNQRNNDIYLARNDISYGDIKDPRKLASTHSGTLNTINFISSNIKRLYT